MLSRFHLIPERDGQTDRIAILISRVSVLTRDKNPEVPSLAVVVAEIKNVYLTQETADDVLLLVVCVCYFITMVLTLFVSNITEYYRCYY